MEGGERKEEAALPPDYVSLTQLQERWLQKQEEMKLKQKQEEEEKRERDARELKQRQEEEEKRERNARAQNGRNQNHRGGAKIGGGFVRATGVIQEKGKGKEIVLGGLGDGGENNKKIGKGGRGKKKRYFKGAAAIEEKAKVGGAEEVLSGGGGGIFSGEGGSVGGSSGVEEIGCVSVVEVLPRNGETADVNRSDLRGEFKKNGRGKGKPRGNELKRSEVAIDLEEEEGGKKWSGSGRGREGRSERGVDRGRGRGGDRGRVRRRGRGEERWSDRGGEGGSERDVDRGRGSEEEGEREGERGGERGRGSERGGGRARGGERGGERGLGRGRGGERGKNGSDPQRKINMLKEYRPLVVEGNEVDLKLENKADLDDISEVCSEIASLRVGDRNEIGGPDNRAKEDGAEGEGSNSDKVAVEIEKKLDHRVLARKGDNGGSWMGYRPIGIQGLDRKAKEDGVEGEGSKGEIVAVGIEKKVEHKVLPRKGENRGYGKGYRENGIWGRENKAKEDGVEGGGSNSDELAVEIENKVDHKVFRRKGENGGFWRAYPAIRNQGGGFGRGRSYTRHDDFRMKWRESGRVWVKREDKLDA